MTLCKKGKQKIEYLETIVYRKRSMFKMNSDRNLKYDMRK